MATRRRSRRPQGTARDYPRTARLNELLREIVAEELERIDDDRLALVTVISVDVDSDLRHARVYYDNLDGAEGDEEMLEALGEVRVRLQAAVGRQARVKRTPELSFAPDPAVRSGERIDAILRERADLGLDPGVDGDAGGDGDGGGPAEPGGGTGSGPSPEAGGAGG